MIYKRKELSEIEMHARDLFTVFDGPPRAYFELPTPGGNITRGIYKSWALSTDDPNLVDELFEKLKLHLDALKEMGGVVLVWRRYPEYSIDGGGDRHQLSARFMVFDGQLDEIMWPVGTHCADGIPTPLARG